MQEQVTNQSIRMLISEDRLSDELRDVANTNGWPLLEGISSISAVHACVVLRPQLVCIEYRDPIRTVPDLLRRLSGLASIGRVACLVPNLTAGLESALVRARVDAFTSIEDAAEWLSVAVSDGLCESTHESIQETDRQRQQRTNQRANRQGVITRVNRRHQATTRGVTP